MCTSSGGVCALKVEKENAKVVKEIFYRRSTERQIRVSLHCTGMRQYSMLSRGRRDWGVVGLGTNQKLNNLCREL